jgi:transcriptional regulator with PAS, ATPase and Fis domain
VIPPLKDRREDVPLLFYVYVRNELEYFIKNEDDEGRGIPNDAALVVHVSLDVMERLMARDLLWQGNIRQLQALTKIVGTKVWLSRPKDCYNGKKCYFNITLSELGEGFKEVGLIH